MPAWRLFSQDLKERRKNFNKDQPMFAGRDAVRCILSRRLIAVAFSCVALSFCSGRSMSQSAKNIDIEDAQDIQAAQATKPQTNDPQAQMGGVNTGEAHAPVLDSEHRPITAGGFVKVGP